MEVNKNVILLLIFKAEDTKLSSRVFKDIAKFLPFKKHKQTNLNLQASLNVFDLDQIQISFS